MKNIVCPISKEVIPEYIPRINGFISVLLLSTFFITEFVPIAMFLAFDFLLRGFSLSKYSLVAQTSKLIGKTLNIQSRAIKLAPKLFAARLGGVMVIAIVLAQILNLTIVVKSLTIIVVSLATAEFAFSFCLGCYIYSWIVLPLSTKK